MFEVADVLCWASEHQETRLVFASDNIPKEIKLSNTAGDNAGKPSPACHGR